ncbi:MAG: hypothetical protein ABIE36_01255 [Candidatus Diapherotrites archaeon]
MRNVITEIYKKHVKKSTIVLKMNEITYIPLGNIVDTSILSPCVGVVIHDGGGQRAYAGHFPNPQEYGVLERLLKESLSKLGDSKKLDVYIAGISTDEENPDLSNRYTVYELENREFVISLLKKYGFQDFRTHIKWTPKPGCCSCLKLDVDSGKNEYILFENSIKKPLYRGDIKKA